MSRTRLQLRQAVYNYLDEPTNSQTFDLREGAGGGTAGATTPGDTVINDALNKRLAELARTCVAVPGITGNVTVPAGGLAPMSLLVTNDSIPGALWAVRRVVVGTTTLHETSRSDAILYDVAGSVDSWFPVGTWGIGLDPAPSVTTVIVASGLQIPPALTADSAAAGTPSWLPDDLDELPVWGACVDMCEKKRGNPKFDNFLEVYLLRYNLKRHEAWQRLVETDQQMALLFPNDPLGPVRK